MGIGVRFDNCFGVYLCSWTTFIFYVSINSGIWFWQTFWVIFYFLGPQRTIFGAGEGFINCFGVYSCSWTTSILYFLSILIFVLTQFWGDFWLSGVMFYFFRPQLTIFGVGEGFKICFWVYSCSWTTFIFYSSFNSDFWLRLNFGAFFIFWVSNGLFMGLR